MKGGLGYTENIFGYPITCMSIHDCVKTIFKWVDNGEKGRYLSCANPHSMVVAQSDPGFREAILNSDLIVPDGAGIVFASKILGGRIANRITGSDIFANICLAANQRRTCRMFFLGSNENTLAIIKTKMKRRYPHIEVVGTYSPPFRDTFSAEENRQMVKTVNSARPDILWVGMTAPKQEKWIYMNKGRFNAPFIGAIGAVFDFFAGTKKRSSDFWITMGLEWLPRFIREPKRLWERNLKSTPIFLMWIIREKIKRTEGPI